MQTPGIVVFAVLMAMAAFLSCARQEPPLREQANAAEDLVMPREWFCPWCGRDASGRAWSPEARGTEGLEHKSPRYPGGLQFRTPREYPLHWGEGVAGRRTDPGPMTEADARLLLERWAADRQGFEVGSIENLEGSFVGEILSDNAVVGRVEVDKATGWFRQAD
jgi:hypothetical protein